LACCLFPLVLGCNGQAADRANRVATVLLRAERAERLGDFAAAVSKYEAALALVGDGSGSASDEMARRTAAAGRARALASIKPPAPAQVPVDPNPYADLNDVNRVFRGLRRAHEFIRTSDAAKQLERNGINREAKTDVDKQANEAEQSLRTLIGQQVTWPAQVAEISTDGVSLVFREAGPSLAGNPGRSQLVIDG